MSFNFSVLNPDTALNPPVKNKKKQDKEKEIKKTKVTANGVNKNIKKKNEDDDLRAMAFGQTGNKSKHGNRKGSASNKENEKNKKSKKNKEDETDEDWQKRDEEFVRLENEKSLRAAIIQSKLDFEQSKSLAKASKEESPVKEAPTEHKKTSKNNKTKKKKDKAVVLSLEQFNNLQPGQIQKIREGGSLEEEKRPVPASSPTCAIDRAPIVQNDEKFFNEVDELTRQTLIDEHRKDEYKNNINKNKIQDESKRIAKLVQDIEKRDFEIQALRLEVESLRGELKTVKTRNKKLCEVMGSSEMRSKGELVVELDKATRSRDEISEEVARLTGDLEQERTKVSHLNQELKRLGGRKRAVDTK